MKNKLTPDEFLKLFGALMFGLGNQYTALIKSRAGLPYIELKTGLRLANYATAEHCEKAAREVFETLKINADLLEACKAAREVWDSNSASLDPDEVVAMLDDAIKQAETK